MTQEGFRRNKNTMRQLRRYTTALEDASLTKSELHVMYIDFENAFGSIHLEQLKDILTYLHIPPNL